MNFKLRVLLIMALLSPFAGCKQDPAALLESAKAAHAKGKLDQAIIELKSALQEDPNNAEIRFLLGRVYNQVFDGASAEKELLRARELGLVSGGRVEAELGFALRLQGKPKQLLETVKPSEAYEPEVLALVHSLRGDAQFFLRDIQAARKSLESAVAIAPSLPEVELLQAKLRLPDRDLDGAIQIVERVIAKHPGQVDAHTLHAELLMAQGKEEQALTAYGRILELNPRQMKALLGRSTLLVKMGRLDEAQKDVDVLRRTYRASPIGMHQQALIHYQRGEYRQALDLLQAVQRNAPEYAPAMLLTGLVHSRLGSPLQAENMLSRYLALNPSNIYARRELASVLVQLRQSTRALETLDPLLRSDQANASVYAIAGDIYAQLGQLGKAREWLQRASAASPNQPAILSRDAIMSARAGDLDRAIEKLENATSLSKAITESDGMLLAAYLYRKDADKALALVKELEADAPKDPRTHYFRGVVMLDLDKQEDAKKAFEKALGLMPTFIPAVETLVRMDLEAGASASARARYEAVLAVHKSNLEALLGLASLLGRTGDTTGAAATLERAASLHPSALEPRARLVDLYLRQGDKDKARASAQAAWTANPNHPAAMEMVGAVQLATGEVNTALNTFSSLVRTFPKSEKGHYAMGQAQLAAGRPKEAEASFRRALELDAKLLPAQLKLVGLLMEQKRYDEALRFVRKLQKEDPKGPSGLTFEGEVLAAQDKWREAAAAFRSALSLQFVDKVAVRLYQVQTRAGESEAAISELKRTVEKHPAAMESRTALADALLARGDFQAAAREYEGLREIFPRHALIANNLAWAYWRMKDARAKQLAEEAYKLDPKNPVVADTLGWILAQSGEVKRGRTLIEQAIGKAPEIPAMRYHYAAVLAESGEKAKAREELKRALASNQQFAELPNAKALLERLN